MKLKVLLLLFSFFSLNILSQDILISFDGKDQATSNQLSIDEVKIDNLTTGKTITVKESSMNLNLTTVLSVGNLDVFETFKGIKSVYPNPVNSEATIDFFSEGNSKSTIVAYNIQGKEITRLERKFNVGHNKVEFKPGNAGIYFIKLVDSGKSYYSKVISINKNSLRASLIYLESQKKNKKSTNNKTTNNFFTKGDVLRLVATSGTFKNTIYDSPKASKTYTFNFIENYYKFEPYLVQPEYPSFVNIMFSVTNQNNQGVDNLENTDFEVLENDAKISPSESFRFVKKLNQVPSKQRTVIMLDKSLSVRTNLGKIKSSAIKLVNTLADNQEIAIYAFSESPILLQDFTADKSLLETAINSIAVDFPTTNLYGSIITGLNKIQNKYTLDGIEEGFLIVLTDGDDTQASSTLEQVISSRGNKRVFVVGLGSDLSEDKLNQIAFPGNYINAVNVDDLENTFTQIRLDMLRFANSFYWLNYMTPKRKTSSNLTIKTKENKNTEADKDITKVFSSFGFESVLSGVYVNVKAGKRYGLDTLKINYRGTGDFKTDSINKVTNGFEPTTLKAITFWADDVPKFDWQITDDTYLNLKKNLADESKVILQPKKNILNTTSKIILKDLENNYENEIFVKISHSLPLVKILNVTDITSNSINVEYEITKSEYPINEVLVQLKNEFEEEPTIVKLQREQEGTFTAEIKDLISNANYKVNVFAKNRIGSSINVGKPLEFKTLVGKPTIATGELEDFECFTAIIKGNKLINDGGKPITRKGIVYSVRENPIVSAAAVLHTGNEKEFMVKLNLNQQIRYYIRAFVENSEGVSYGKQIIIDTPIFRYSNPINFTTQTQIDNFFSNNKYKYLCEIRSSVNLKGIDINSLLPFNKIKKITNAIIIQQTSLVNLEGLESLESELYSLNINTNTKLISLKGLEKAKKITLSLNISGNNSLKSLEGLEGLESVRDLTINSNNAIVNLKGLNNLNRVSGNQFNILFNAELLSLEGLESLTYINNGFRVEYNSKLETLKGLDNLQKVSTFTIKNNESIKSLEGLGSLDNIANLYIENNPEFNSMKGIDNLKKIQIFNIQNNRYLLNLDGLESIESLNSLNVKNNSILSSIKGLTNSKVTANLSIENNRELKTLEGLESIESLYNLLIKSNSKLISLAGINNLKIVSNSLFIENNAELINLNGLETLDTNRWLRVINNKKLIDFCSINKKVIDKYANNTFGISNNRYNPTLQDLKEEKCKE